MDYDDARCTTKQVKFVTNFVNLSAAQNAMMSNRETARKRAGLFRLFSLIVITFGWISFGFYFAMSVVPVEHKYAMLKCALAVLSVALFFMTVSVVVAVPCRL